MRSDHISIKDRGRQLEEGEGERALKALTERGDGPKNSDVHSRSDEFMQLSCVSLVLPCLPTHLSLGPPEPCVCGTPRHWAFAHMVPAVPLL